MRKEEILSLEWENHIDLRHGFILLDVTKNGERRQIPITPMLRGTLQGIVRRVVVPYVFVDRDGKRFKDVKTSFHGALRRAGIKILDGAFNGHPNCTITAQSKETELRLSP